MSWRTFVEPGQRMRSPHAVGVSSRELDRPASRWDRVADAPPLLRKEVVDDGGLSRTGRAFNFDFSKIQIEDPAARNRAARSGATVAPPVVHRVLASPGEPLTAEESQKFQTGLGRSLAHVRLHRDALAVESANAVDAAAYTVGPHIVLGRAHAPGSRALRMDSRARAHARRPAERRQGGRDHPDRGSSTRPTSARPTVPPTSW